MEAYLREILLKYTVGWEKVGLASNFIFNIIDDCAISTFSGGFKAEDTFKSYQI